MSAMHVTDELLSAEVDGVLTGAEAADLATHLETCAACAHRRDLMRATAVAVADLPEEELPRPLDLSFLSPAVDSPVVLTPRSWRPPAWVAPVLAAAAVLLVAVNVAPGLLHGHGTGAPNAATGARVASPQAVEGFSNQGGTGAAPAAAPGGAQPGAGADTAVAPQQKLSPSGASHTFADAGGLVLTLNPSTASAGANQPVTFALEARAGQAIALSQLSLEVRGPSGAGTIARSSAPGLAQGQQASLSATWTAGQVGGVVRTGDYIVEGQAVLADGRTYSVSVVVHVS